jgi:hypothetical protein
MPFSFSNISSTAIIGMVLFLSIAELLKFLKKRTGHSAKQFGGNPISK